MHNVRNGPTERQVSCTGRSEPEWYNGMHYHWENVVMKTILGYDKLRPDFLPAPELPTFSESGVDLTLIRWMLSLTYKQRLEALQKHVNFAGKVKRAPSNSPIRADIPDPSETQR